MLDNNKKILLATLAVTSIGTTWQAYADQRHTPSNESNETLESEITSEVAVSNMIIYSQEYMRHFFADSESDIQPLPASGISLFGAYGLTKNTRWLSAITIPLREEEVRKRDAETFRYYYPKLLLTGFEFDFFQKNVFKNSSILRLSSAIGVSLPLSYRILSYIPPFVLSRAAIRIAKNVDLNFGIGYSGQLKSGAWFFPFGISYRLNVKDLAKTQ